MCIRDRAYAPGSSKEFPEEVLANVWNWDEQWKVEWFENGTCMGEMTRCKGEMDSLVREDLYT